MWIITCVLELWIYGVLLHSLMKFLAIFHRVLFNHLIQSIHFQPLGSWSVSELLVQGRQTQ